MATAFLGTGVGGPARVALIGVPYDRTQSFRRGAAAGPRAVREASWSLETYSPVLGVDMLEAGVRDLGDLDVADLDPPAMVRRVQEAVAGLDPGVVPVLLGGDHTATVGAVGAVAARFPQLRAVVLDAHLDLRHQYEGSPWSHACTVRRLWEALGDARVVLLGVRSGLKEEWEFARRHCRWVGGSLALPEAVLVELRGYPVYLSVDLDVADPAYAPGVGNPEPGGPALSEVLQALYLLRGLSVVGMDLVEVAPGLDPSGATAVAAAKLVREMVLAFCGSAPAR